MNLSDLFPRERVFVNVDVPSREALLKFLSERAGELGLVNRNVCSRAVADREELGSTGLGDGIAIPHARLESLEATVGLLAVLSRPIDFEAVDQEQVDIVMMMLLPEHSGGDQLKDLARIAKFARQKPAMKALRRAESVDEVIDILQGAQDDSQPTGPKG
jgi:PTS system nitrogen regulatory IIA component